MKEWLTNVGIIAYTDLLQKFRQKSTVVILIGFMLFTFFCFPTNDSPYRYSISFRSQMIDSARGVYNSDWIGVLIIVYFGTILFIGGIFFIRKTLRREQQAGYGALMATSPISKTAFFEGKRLSNFIYLAFLLLIVELLGMLIQFLRFESHQFKLFAYALPYLLIILPFVYFLATMALVFEVVPFMKGSAGNIGLFILSLFALVFPLFSLESGQANSFLLDLADISGMKFVLQQVQATFVAAFGNPSSGFVIFGNSPPYSHFFTFHLEWRDSFILSRGLLVLGTFCLLYLLQLWVPLASIFQPKAKQNRRRPKAKLKITTEQQGGLELPNLGLLRGTKRIALKRIKWLQLSYYQLLLILRNQKGSSLVACVVLVVQWFPNKLAVNQTLFIIATIVPLFIWSQMGCNEEEDYLKTTLAYPTALVLSNLFGQWLLGVIYFSGTLVKTLFAGEWLGSVTLLVSLLFTISLASASHCFVKSELLFEVTYLFIWYIELVQKVRIINLFNPDSKSKGTIFGLLIGSLLLLSLVFLKKRRNIYLKKLNKI